MCNEVSYNDYKIYGVTFNGNSSTGIRLYNAKGLQFTPSSNSKEGVDDFYAIKDSPFHTRKCIREYTSEGQEQYTFEDTDPIKYNELKKNRIGIRMIAFPKFYYNRPDEWTFLVSSKYVPGFEISPAHCKRETIDGPLVEYDYVYVSEFMVNSNGDISQPGYTPKQNTSMDQFRKLAFDSGMYVEDLSIRMMITMLAIIKYANLNSKSIIGKGHNHDCNTDIQYDDILGHDGYRTSNTDNTSIKVMDLVDFYGNAGEFIEGCCVFNSEVYVNNDTKTITGYPKMINYKQLGWTSTGIIIPEGYKIDFTNITYNTDYKYIMAPQIVNGRPNPFGDKLWHTHSDKGALLIFGGDAWFNDAAGLLYWDSVASFFASASGWAARFIAFGNSSLL